MKGLKSDAGGKQAAENLVNSWFVVLDNFDRCYVSLFKVIRRSSDCREDVLWARAQSDCAGGWLIMERVL